VVVILSTWEVSHNAFPVKHNMGVVDLNLLIDHLAHQYHICQQIHDNLDLLFVNCFLLRDKKVELRYKFPVPIHNCELHLALKDSLQ
jgi:hypothetical protein